MIEKHLNFRLVIGLALALAVFCTVVHFVHGYQMGRNSHLLKAQAVQADEAGQADRAVTRAQRYLSFVPGDPATLEDCGDVLAKRARTTDARWRAGEMFLSKCWTGRRRATTCGGASSPSCWASTPTAMPPRIWKSCSWPSRTTPNWKTCSANATRAKGYDRAAVYYEKSHRPRAAAGRRSCPPRRPFALPPRTARTRRRGDRRDGADQPEVGGRLA